MANIDLNNIYEWPIKRQLVVFGLIFLMTMYAGYHFDLSSFNTKIANNQEAENDLKNQITLVLNKEKKVASSIAQYSQAEILLTEWKKKLISYPHLPEMIDNILKLGANNNLYFSRFTLAPNVKVNSYVKVPIKTIVIGNYHQIATFLSQIANMPSIVAIENFTLLQPNKEAADKNLPDTLTDKNLLAAEIVLAIYYLPENKS